MLVADLRRELDRRRLEKAGLKPDLVERLRSTLLHNGEGADKIVVDQEEYTKKVEPARKAELDDEGASSWADCEGREESDGLIRAKTLSRAAIESIGLESSNEEHQMEGTPSCWNTCSIPGSSTGSDAEGTTFHEECQLGAMADQVREPEHFPECILQPLLSKIESPTHVIDEERKEAREREQQLLSKISEVEKMIMILPKIDALSMSVEKEREEAKDREQRLSTKIRELERIVISLHASVEESNKKCSHKIDKFTPGTNWTKIRKGGLRQLARKGRQIHKLYKRVQTTKKHHHRCGWLEAPVSAVACTNRSLHSR